MIPSTDEAEFPYERAKQFLVSLPGMEVSEVDFPAMIAAGKRIGWTKEMIDMHWDLMAGDRCFSFSQGDPPNLRGTMYEDNIFFTYADGDHEDLARAEIEKLAKLLKVRILEY